MIRAWRFPLTLALSVVFAAPVLGDALMHADDLLGAGLHYLAALALSWLGVTFIIRLVDGYTEQNEAAEQAVLLEQRMAEIEAAREQRVAEEAAKRADQREDAAVNVA